ncbi:hypothetical protein ACOQNP_02525 [Ectopseudomonas khazarica]|uniref:hypothetical protein n=1 Tax=Ectopseudomonas khazarica TaxID=2502979 RepID=UPI000AF26DE0
MFSSDLCEHVIHPLKTAFGAVAALILAGCTAGMINVQEAVEDQTTSNADSEQKTILSKAKKGFSYLSIKAMYLAPGSPQLPPTLKSKSGIALEDLCKSGLKFDDQSLVSVIGVNLSETGTINEKTSIPVLGFTLHKSGNDCSVVGTSKTITNNYPIYSNDVQINYFLRSTSANELPFGQIQAAVNLIGPTLSKYTVVYKISTTAVLQKLGEEANSTIEANLKASVENSKSIHLSPLTRNQEFFIPLIHIANETKTNVGFLRISSSITPSAFTNQVKNGFPNYTNAELNNYKSQDGSETPLSQFILEQREQIITNGDKSKESLDKICEKISTKLRDNYAFTTPDRAFLITRILSAHENFNAPMPKPSLVDSQRRPKLEELEEFTNLPCLENYKAVFSESSYGLKWRLESYQKEIDEISAREFKFNDSTYLFDQLSIALGGASKDTAKSNIESILRTTPPVSIDNYARDSNISSTITNPAIEPNKAAQLLANRLNPGKIGCYIGLSNELLRASLYASGYDAYALYKSDNRDIGYKGWLRIVIAHTSDGSVPTISKISLIKPDTEEPKYLLQKAGEGGISSPYCQRLLGEFPTRSI